MRFLAYILTILLLAASLSGCGSTLSLSRPIGDGKGYVSVSDGGAFIGYKGAWGRGKATPAPNGKAVVAPAVQPAAKPGIFQTVKGWFGA